LIVLLRSAASEAFVAKLSSLFTEAADGVMLTAGIHQAYHKGVTVRSAQAGVKLLAQGKSSGQPNRGVAALFATEAKTFIAEASLQDEIFGPSSLIIWCDNQREIDAVVGALHGNLTATLHGTDAELVANTSLLAKLEAIAGRVVINGFPTGVEVSHAIVHGGPYPSLSDGRTTSVGSNAIYRFTRLTCYQTFPDAVLPAELQNANTLGLSRLVNGTRSSAAL
jgi:NADP-dependent aldehyde dehydrogenase